jgi:hypothetical protein
MRKEFIAPCEKLKHLDKRYRTKYAMSMVEYLENIRKLGIRKFVENETERWACPECNAPICVHDRKCYTCSAMIRREEQRILITDSGGLYSWLLLRLMQPMNSGVRPLQ